MNSVDRPSTRHTGPRKRAILYLTWGDNQADKVGASVRESRLPPCDVFWITDVLPENPLPNVRVIQASFSLSRGCLPKAELHRFVPSGYDSYLYLDSDTRVLADIDLGFELAEKTGLAMAQATIYSLDDYANAAQIMDAEGIPMKGQLLHNAGVIFFSLTPQVSTVLKDWEELALRYQARCGSDQLLLALAMERQSLHPSTLPITFNYRAFGELISGKVRIFHSRRPVPKDINRHAEFRRYVKKGRVRYPWHRRPGLVGKALRWVRRTARNGARLLGGHRRG
jgi:hypothetical protein